VSTSNSQQIIFNDETKVSPLQSEARQECELSPLIFNIVLEILATATTQEKQVRVTKNRKEEITPVLYKLFQKKE